MIEIDQEWNREYLRALWKATNVILIGFVGLGVLGLIRSLNPEQEVQRQFEQTEGEARARIAAGQASVAFTGEKDWNIASSCLAIDDSVYFSGNGEYQHFAVCALCKA